MLETIELHYALGKESLGSNYFIVKVLFLIMTIQSTKYFGN